MAGDDQNRNTSPVLAWVEAATRTIAPMAIATALGGVLVMWQQSAVLDARLSYVEAQINKGDRFTASDGSRLKTEIDLLFSLHRSMEDEVNEHIRRGEAGFERIRRLEQDMADCEKRCGR